MTGNTESTANDATFPEVKPPPGLAEYVRQTVRQDILSGRLEPEDRITELSVMHRTSVSRTPVREGLRMLQLEGLVVFKPGRGTYVAPPLSATEALLIYDLRLQLEPYLTRLAVERMTNATLRQVTGLVEEFRSAVHDDASVYEIGRIDTELHDSIYKASKSDLYNVFQSYWSRLQSQLTSHVYSVEAPRVFSAEHATILAAIGAGDAEAAGTAMEEHIAHGREILRKSFPAGSKALDAHPSDVGVSATSPVRDTSRG